MSDKFRGVTSDPRIIRTRRAVLDAVTDLIAEGGWDAVTHVHVAERSGYARSTIYRHWPERIDFLRDVSDEAEGMAHPAEATGDLRSDLLGEILAFRDVLFDRGGGLRLAALLGVAEHSSEAGEIRSSSVARGEGPLRRRIEQAVADGVLEAVDPVMAAGQLFGPVTHLRLMSTSRPNDDALAAVVDGFLERHAS